MKRHVLSVCTGIMISLGCSAQAIDFTAVQARYFDGFRTTKAPGSGLDEIQEKYVYLGTMEVRDGMLEMVAPPGSVTTFYSK